MSNNDDGAFWSALVGLIGIIGILLMAYNMGVL